MKLKTTGRRVVDETPYGTYVWQAPDGEFLGDGEGRLLSVFAMRGDLSKITALAKVAAAYGYKDGSPVFWAGKRKITDEEYEEQTARDRLGLVADPLDYAAIRDELRAKRNA